MRSLEDESRKASDNKKFLTAFLLDLIGLLVLEKNSNIVKRNAEQKAAELGGRESLSSPGPIHDWDLENQIQLCSLLPLDQINLQIREESVLTPFKSLSCLIEIGPEYKASLVGTTCQVCSKNENCQMSRL